MTCKRQVVWGGKVKTIEVPEHSYAWSGSMPCTGVYRCIHCGKPAPKKNPGKQQYRAYYNYYLEPRGMRYIDFEADSLDDAKKKARENIDANKNFIAFTSRVVLLTDAEKKKANWMKNPQYMHPSAERLSKEEGSPIPLTYTDDFDQVHLTTYGMRMAQIDRQLGRGEENKMKENPMKGTSKSVKFYNNVEKYVRSLNPGPGKLGYKWSVDTIYGPLYINIQESEVKPRQEVFSIYTRFKDPKLASKNLAGVNEYSGKWNFHYSSSTVILNIFKRQLDNILIKSNPVRGMGHFPRDFWIPKGATVYREGPQKSIVYGYSDSRAGGKPGIYAIGFKGKANKPAWNYRFSSEEKRKEYVDKWFEGLQRSEDFKKKRAEARKAPAPQTIVEGVILYDSWGYEQTNIDFYKVMKRSGSMVTLAPMTQRQVEDTGWLQGKVVPDKPILDKNKWLRRKVLKDGGKETSVKIHSFSWAYPWDGTPKWYSSYHNPISNTSCPICGKKVPKKAFYTKMAWIADHIKKEHPNHHWATSNPKGKKNYPAGTSHYVISQDQPQQCMAHHLTFGGRCLNCGGTYDMSGKLEKKLVVGNPLTVKGVRALAKNQDFKMIKWTGRGSGTYAYKITGIKGTRMEGSRAFAKNLREVVALVLRANGHMDRLGKRNPRTTELKWQVEDDDGMKVHQLVKNGKIVAYIKQYAGEDFGSEYAYIRGDFKPVFATEGSSAIPDIKRGLEAWAKGAKGIVRVIKNPRGGSGSRWYYKFPSEPYAYGPTTESYESEKQARAAVKRYWGLDRLPRGTSFWKA